jgi:hypothetical protein
MTNQTKIILASITVIVAAGLLALSPSMIGNAQAQMYDNQYGYDNNYYQDDNRYSYDKNDPKSSHTDIQKIKCVNSNINVNGVDITQIPQDGPGLAAANEEAGPDGANTQNGNGLADRINVERNLVNVCANVNDNEQIKVTPPEEEPTATLSVNKTVTCTPEGTSAVVQNACNTILFGTGNPLLKITAYEFLIDVSGNNPNPSQFPGPTSPVDVTLGAGNYQVTETPQSSVQTKVSTLDASSNRLTVTGPFATFTGDCSQTDDFEATGTIAAGESQTCDIENNFVASPETP